MKRLLIFLIVFLPFIRGEAQTTTTSDRVVTKSLYLRDWWVDSVKRDTNFLGGNRSIPTAAAVYNFVAGRGAPGYTSVTSLPDSSGLIFHGPNGVKDTVVFEGETGGSGSSLPSMTGNAGKVLTTDGTTASWGTVSGGATTTTALTDVSDAVPANNSTLVYNQDSLKYVPTQVAQYNLTAPQNGDLLKYQDGQWVNFTPTYGSGGGSSSFDSIAVTGSTSKLPFAYRRSDTALVIVDGGNEYAWKLHGSNTAIITNTIMASAFSAANGTLLSAYSPEVGSGSWVEENGNVSEIQDGQAQLKSGATGDNIASYDIGLSDNYKITAVGTVSSTSSSLQLWFRFGSVTTSGHVIVITPTYIEMYSAQSGGNFTQTWAETGAPPGTTEHTYEIYVQGTSMSLYKDGVMFRNITLPYTLTGTKVAWAHSGTSWVPGQVKLNSITVTSL
jgi:hypothetical protein